MSANSPIVLPYELGLELPTDTIGHAARRFDAATVLRRPIGPARFTVDAPWTAGCWAYGATSDGSILRIGNDVDGAVTRGFLFFVRSNLVYRGPGSEEVGTGVSYVINQWNTVGIRRLGAGSSTVKLILNNTEDASGAVAAGTAIQEGDVLGWGGPGFSGAGWNKWSGRLAWGFLLQADAGSTAEVNWILRNPIAALAKYGSLIRFLSPFSAGPTASLDVDLSAWRHHVRVDGATYAAAPPTALAPVRWRPSFTRLVYVSGAVPPSGFVPSLRIGFGAVDFAGGDVAGGEQVELAGVGSAGGRSQSDSTVVAIGSSTVANAGRALAASLCVGVGLAIAAATGTAYAQNTAQATATAITASGGASVSQSTATAPLAAIASGAGISTAPSTASGGGATTASGAGTSHAQSLVRATGGAIASGAGVSAGEAFVRGTGAAIGAGAGVSTSQSVAQASGIGLVTVSRAGISHAQSSAVAVGQAQLPGVFGVTHAQSSATAVGVAIAAGAGASIGSTAVRAAGASTAAAAATSLGQSSALGGGVSTATGSGASSSQSTAAATGASTVAATGASLGQSMATGEGIAATGPPAPSLYGVIAISHSGPLVFALSDSGPRVVASSRSASIIRAIPESSSVV